ncbi:MAG: helix-turn-helix transcriptional regulator, partial [Odoribacter sp.]|nr:helix-turn-helix transcriptional regulator [Odoribacter sp.]
DDLASRKIQELFIILHAYYTSDELAMLFYPLLGKNMEFKKLVVDYYLHVKSAGEFAELCEYSQGVFQKKFKDVFGETVYQWMQRQKAEYIKHRLMTSEVNLKELADELNFASSVHMNKFCKIWFGMTPSEVRQTFILKKICIEIECVKDNIFYIS